MTKQTLISQTSYIGPHKFDPNKITLNPNLGDMCQV